jgi:hypothetical protein
MTPESLIAELGAQQQQAAQREVPWFLANMPKAYFRSVGQSKQQRHLRAITALSSEQINVPEVVLQDGNEYTFISSESPLGASSVARQIAQLPAAAAINSVQLFSSNDKRLSLNIFSTERDADLRRFSGASDEEKAAAERHVFLHAQAAVRRVQQGKARSPRPTRVVAQS